VKFIIAGAGISGLSAAWRAQEAGCDVVVFEARDRVGGRTFSPRLRNGAATDQGAVSIRVEDHSVRKLCAELEIELIGHGYNYGRSEVGLDAEEPIESVDWIFQGLLERSRQRWADDAGDESVRDAFRAVIGQDYASHLAYASLEDALGVPFERLSADGFVAQYLGEVWTPRGASAADVGHGGDANNFIEHQSRVLGGNGRICDELAARLGPAVRLSSPVVRVAQTRAGAAFELADGSLVHGDAAILALPVPLLRRVELDFELPNAMQRALDTLVQGSAAIVSVELATGAGPRRVSHPTEQWMASNPASANSELMSDPLVATFVGTDARIDRLLGGGPAGVVRRMVELRPDLTFPDDPEVIITDWRKEEWSLGCYPNWGVGWDPEINEAFTERTVGRVGFAGADLSGAFIGGLEGGIKTGEIAVRQLVGHIAAAAA
jgi:monoamine oxidase